MRPVFAQLYQSLLGPELAALRSASRMPWTELAELQRRSLSSLLQHVGRQVPYYGERLRASGVLGEGGRIDLDRFSHLPPLSKQDVRQLGESLPPASRDARWNSSGGSTGEPTRILQDASHRRWSRATKACFDGWSSYEQGLPRIVLWGSQRDRSAGRWWRPALRALKRETWLDAYRMSPEDLVRYEQVIRQVRPVNIYGYAESLHEFARHLIREGRRLPPCAGVVSTAGTLYEDARKNIERAFSSPVFNRYGSRETGEMAAECASHEGLHISPLTHVIEIVRPDGSPCEPGERGELLVTSLVNRAMPLIRYRIGDEASFLEGQCACGCTWPRLATVHGRTTDHVTSKRYGKIHGGAFRFVLNELDWVVRYQIVQNEDGGLQIRLEPRSLAEGEARLPAASGRIRSALHEIMGPECEVDLVLAGSIAPSPSGKHRHVISSVAAPGAAAGRS